MIKPNELRIGNLVYGVSDRIETIKEIHFKGGIFVEVGKTGSEIRSNSEDINGIPLTPEWLNRFGFGYVNNNLEYLSLRINNDIRPLNKSYLSFDLYGDEPSIVGIWTEDHEDEDADDMDCTWTYIPNCKYVHQLPNLFFALTGEELTLK